MSKKCTPLWREAHFEVKMYKAPQPRSTFGSSDAEKVHAIGQNAKNTTCSRCFWTLKRGFAWQVQGILRPAKNEQNVKVTNTQLQLQLQMQLQLHYMTQHYIKLITVHYTTNITVTTLHYTTLRCSYNNTTVRYTTLDDATLCHTTAHNTTVHCTNYTTLHYTTLD